MSVSGQVIQTLTNYAAGIAQDRASAIAEFIAPTVPVGAATGKFKKFNEKNAFQAPDTSRAIGGPAKRLEFLDSDGDLNCAPQALEIAIDDHERDEAGEGDPLGLEKAKVQTLITSAVVSHEKKVMTAIAAGIGATGGIGSWSDLSTNDPIKEIDGVIKTIATNTGLMPNAIVIGIAAWNYVRNHAKTIARQPGASLIGLSTAQFAAMLLNPAIEVRVGVLSYDTTKMGATASKANIVGSECYVFLRSASPTLYDPSFAKTFRTRRGGVEAVRMYRDDKSRSDILALDWSEDIQVVSTTCAARITVS